MRAFIESFSIFCLLVVASGCLANMVLNAAIAEQDFQDNIRLSRCERMTDYERDMKEGYCDF